MISRGFADPQAQNGLVDESVASVTKTLERIARRRITDAEALKKEIRKDLSSFLSKKRASGHHPATGGRSVRAGRRPQVPRATRVAGPACRGYRTRGPGPAIDLLRSRATGTLTGRRRPPFPSNAKQWIRHSPPPSSPL